MIRPVFSAAPLGAISVLPPTRCRLAAAVALALALPGLVFAETEGVPATELPPVTVTATMSEHDVATAPASITIIPRQEIEESNSTDLFEALRGTPGITLSPRGVGGRKGLALRGMDGKHTLTLIDGRRITPSDDAIGHSDFEYGWLPMSAIERIEVVRGPMSTLYGSEALGGVINIITRQPRDRWIGSAALSGTNHTGGDGGDGHRASVFAAGPLGDRVGLRVSAENSRSSAIPLKEDRRYSEIEGRSADAGSIAANFRLTERQTIDLGWSQGRENRFFNDVTTPGVAFQSLYLLDRAHGHLSWRGDFGGWTGQLRAYQSELDIRNKRTMGVAPTRPQYMRDQVIDGFATMRLGGHSLTFGGELREETLKNPGLVGGVDDATHKALFVQDEVALGKQVILTAGVRVDHHEFFGTEASPRVYLVWEASPGLVIKGGYGHAFKAPTLKQVSPSYVGAEGPHTFLGNGDVQPEKSDSVEIGADWTNGPLALRATLFHSEIDDLITQRLIDRVGIRETYLYENLDRARITGVEAGASWAFARGFNLVSDVVLLRAKDRTTGDRLPDRPKVSWASRVEWRGGDWNARVGFEHIGSQLNKGFEDLPSYTLWDASVARRFGKYLSLRAGVENIGNVRLAERSPEFRYAERGRTVFATLRADL